ncbi:MAG: toprim domain-containing protein [Brachymonas sp.]|nr:toprim domain-containing protein [Brachymonas sp.]
MARIPESDLQRLKDDISVQRLIESAGVELKKSGKDWAGKCPFHADDTASLIITPAKNLWHCFGCQVGGGVVDWVMKLRGVSFRHAVELLKDEAALTSMSSSISLAAESSGASSGASVQAVKRSSVRALPAPVALDADDRDLLLQVVSYYQQSLRDCPEALAYLQSRGLNHPELLDHFKLGFANRTLGLRLPSKSRIEGAQLRSRLERLGVYRESGHEHFNGSVVIPILDEHGQVRELYGRKITAKLRPGTPLHLYLPANESRGRGVFNVAALQASAGAGSKDIILCESIIDALTFWCAGYRNVTTAYGVEGFTDELMQAFKANNVARVLIAYDRDEAGDRAADKLAPRLMSEGIECYRVLFPKGMDANEYAMKVQPAAKSLGMLLRQAQWLGKGEKPSHESVSVQEPAQVPTEADLQAKQATARHKTCASSYQNNSESVQHEPLISLAAESVSAVAMEKMQTVIDVDTLPVSRDAAPETVADVSAASGEVMLHFGEGAKARRWRVRGLAKNLAYEVLKVNVLAGCAENFHVDTFDLYAARARAQFVAQAAAELGISEDILKADLGRVLFKLEALQDAQIQAALAPKTPTPAAPTLNFEEQGAALALLQSPDLASRILSDFEACGVVGESTNKLIGYLAAVSRKLDRPLAIVIQSSSAAGKSSLMDAILAFVPEEERIQYSAMTGQSLFYMGQTNLKNKILAIAEEEGASRASYALKLLQSEGELTIASTGTDAATGNLITQEYRVEGPMSLFMTTTAIDIDEELMNRCLVLSVDENRDQTRAIHQLQRQRRTLEGLQRKHEKQAILALHRNAQRLLRPLAVVNPYADRLTFLDDRTRTRRDHEKYLTLIDTITLLHQHQRTIKSVQVNGQAVDYIEASLSDIELANRLAHEVLGTSLDELPPQTRRVLAGIHALVRAKMATLASQQRDIRFSRSEVRTATGLSDTQARLHLERLCAMEYLLTHRGLRGQSFEYELLHDQSPNSDEPHLSGLIDVTDLQNTADAAFESAAQSTTTNLSSRGADAQFAPQTRPQRAPNAVGSRSDESGGMPCPASLLSDMPPQTLHPRATPVREAHTSYAHAPTPAQQTSLAAAAA